MPNFPVQAQRQAEIEAAMANLAPSESLETLHLGDVTSAGATFDADSTMEALDKMATPVHELFARVYEMFKGSLLSKIQFEESKHLARHHVEVLVVFGSIFTSSFQFAQSALRKVQTSSDILYKH